MSNSVHARTSVYNINYHLVWCVKYRRQVLVGKIEQRLKQLLADIAENKSFYIKEMEIVPDHVHVFISAHPKFSSG